MVPCQSALVWSTLVIIIFFNNKSRLHQASSSTYNTSILASDFSFPGLCVYALLCSLLPSTCRFYAPPHIYSYTFVLILTHRLHVHPHTQTPCPSSHTNSMPPSHTDSMPILTYRLHDHPHIQTLCPSSHTDSMTILTHRLHATITYKLHDHPHIQTPFPFLNYFTNKRLILFFSFQAWPTSCTPALPMWFELILEIHLFLRSSHHFCLVFFVAALTTWITEKIDCISLAKVMKLIFFATYPLLCLSGVWYY